MSGRLAVVATPIGNLDDITLRAIRVLREVEVVLAEDTRRTRQLLDAHGIGTRVERLDAHADARQLDRWTERLAAGAALALVTDAGTPLVSDPGSAIVARAVAIGARVEPIPGASAVLAAVTASGLPADTFTFLGFLPRKGGARRDALSAVAASPHAVVLFESPQRVVDTLRELDATLGPTRRVAVCRELTKLYEEVKRGSAGEVAAAFADGEVRGEITLVVEPAPPREDATEVPRWAPAFVETLRAAGTPTRAIADALALATGLPRSACYDLALHTAPPD